MRNAELSCPNSARWLRSCRWKPRYDVGWTKQSSPPASFAEAICAIIDALRSKTYLGDTCIRCGAWTTRHDQTTGAVSRSTPQSSEARETRC